MIASRLRKLTKRRDELRLKLRDHFTLAINERNYKEFEMVVDELDEVRRKIQQINERSRV